MPIGIARRGGVCGGGANEKGAGTMVMPCSIGQGTHSGRGQEKTQAVRSDGFFWRNWVESGHLEIAFADAASPPLNGGGRGGARE